MSSKINIVEATKEQIEELKKELGKHMVKVNDLYIINTPKGKFAFKEIKEEITNQEKTNV